jgi:hypothetical protein
MNHKQFPVVPVLSFEEQLKEASFFDTNDRNRTVLKKSGTHRKRIFV